MKLIIKSKKLWKTLTFTMPGRGYIYVDLNGQPGTLGFQLCEKGSLMYGSALVADEGDYANFEYLCRKWYRQYLNNNKSDL